VPPMDVTNCLRVFTGKGASVGANEGDCVGDLLGFTVGGLLVTVGCKEGKKVGALVGFNVTTMGEVDGLAVGDVVGMDVGEEDWLLVGLIEVGWNEGKEVEGNFVVVG
jgi:hypothetical protein